MCSSMAVGERALSLRPRSRHCSRVRWMLCCTFYNSSQYFTRVERHCCSDRPSTLGSDVWVAVEVTAVGVSQSHKEVAPQAGSSVWTAKERVATGANLVTLCCSRAPWENCAHLLYYCPLGRHAAPTGRFHCHGDGDFTRTSGPVSDRRTIGNVGDSWISRSKGPRHCAGAVSTSGSSAKASRMEKRWFMLGAHKA